MTIEALTAARLIAPLATEGVSAMTSKAGQAADKVREVAEDFESLFLSELLKQMRQTLEPGELFGRNGGDVYGGLFDFFMGKHLAGGGGVGLADFLQRQIQTEQSR